MTAQEILDQIESLKSKKSSAEGRVQILTKQLNKYKEEFDTLKQKCVDDFQCQPKELKSLIASKQIELENKLTEINDKIEELQEED
jgi:chaperonin cofactor prefoldin